MDGTTKLIIKSMKKFYNSEIIVKDIITLSKKLGGLNGVLVITGDCIRCGLPTGSMSFYVNPENIEMHVMAGNRIIVYSYCNSCFGITVESDKEDVEFKLKEILLSQH